MGLMILGHANPHIIDAVKKAADDGLSFGAPTTFETTIADKICDIVPSVELIRMTNSGTETYHVRDSPGEGLHGTG